MPMMVKVSVTAPEDGEAVFYTVQLEVKDATTGEWHPDGGLQEFNTESEKGEERELLVADNGRVVITGQTNYEEVWNPNTLMMERKKKEVKKPDKVEQDGEEGRGAKAAPGKSETGAGAPHSAAHQAQTSRATHK